MIRFCLGLCFAAQAFAAPYQAVVVQDSALELLARSMATNVRSQLARKLELPVENFTVEVENLSIEPHVDLRNLRGAQVMGLGALGGRRLEGLFALPVLVQTADGEREVQASGVLSVTGPVYVAKTGLLRGHVLSKADLLVTRLPWRGLASGSIGLSAKDLIGSRVTSMVPAGEPFMRAQLDEPLAVKNGEAVELTVVSGPGVVIRSRAVARQEGKLGDFIRVEQPDTKKALTATVTGEKSVEVKL